MRQQIIIHRFLNWQCVSVVRRRNNYVIGTLGTRTAQSLFPWQPSSVCQVTAAWFSISEARESNVGMFCSDNIFHNYLRGFCILMGSKIGFELVPTKRSNVDNMCANNCTGLDCLGEQKNKNKKQIVIFLIKIVNVNFFFKFQGCCACL